MNRQVEIIRKHTITLNDSECEYLKDLVVCMKELMDIVYVGGDELVIEKIEDKIDNLGNMYLNDLIKMFNEKGEVK
jgi:hypothetical protein